MGEIDLQCSPNKNLIYDMGTLTS